MDIKDQSITQIILVKHDQIPINRLRHSTNLEVLSNMFNFTRADGGEAPGGRKLVLLEEGIFERDDESPRLSIDRLLIEDRKIQIQMEGTSGDSQLVFAELKSLFGNLKDLVENEYLQPVVMTFESTITARLEIPFAKLLSAQLVSFVSGKLTDLTSDELAETRIALSNLSFDIDYQPRGEELGKHRITLSRKKFVVEPRAGYPPEEQVYVSQAPLDSKSHLELLSELERIFKGN